MIGMQAVSIAKTQSRGQGGMGKKSRTGSKPARRDAFERERIAAGQMIRFVIDPQGHVLPDLAGKLPGRGIWLKPEKDRIERAAKRGVFSRSARRPVHVDPGLPERVERLLIERMLETASLARRAGEILTGFDQVQAEMKSNRDGILLIAHDAGNEAKRLIANRRNRRYIAVFDRGELGAKLGRDQVVYAFIASGGLAERLVSDARRLSGFRNFEMALALSSMDETSKDEEHANGRVSLTQ